MMKPNAKVLEQVANGRGVIGPVTVGRGSVRMWRAYRDSSMPNVWEISLQDTDGNNVAGIWVYTVPTNGGRPMLWEKDY